MRPSFGNKQNRGQAPEIPFSREKRIHPASRVVDELLLASFKATMRITLGGDTGTDQPAHWRSTFSNERSPAQMKLCAIGTKVTIEDEDGNPKIPR